jgi:hypothetical protein
VIKTSNNSNNDNGVVEVAVRKRSLT